MEQDNSKKEIIAQLQREILLLQGFKPSSAADQHIGLGALEAAFPNAVFPTGAIHEFLCANPEGTAASQGFIAGILNGLMQKAGICLYISRCRNLFPTALYTFGVEPHQVIFVDPDRERDILWTMEEALKCKELAAVVAEVRDITFAQSRRLQLALEKSHVTGFIIRTDTNRVTSTACVARWQIKPLESEQKEGLPGLGFPRWQVELLRVRNGNPGTWQIEWSAGKFKHVSETTIQVMPKRKTG